MICFLSHTILLNVLSLFHNKYEISKYDTTMLSYFSAGRFESLIPVGVQSKVGKVVKPKSFKNNGVGQPFIFEGGAQSYGKPIFWVETSARK